MLEFIKDHYQDIFAVIGAIITAASIIVRLTPSQKDDAVLAKIIKVLDTFSVFNPNKEEKK